MTPAQARKLALALPEAAEAPHFDFASFRVRGKIFATMPPAGTHLHVFVGDEEREMALVLHDDCVAKLLWGGKVVGVRIDLGIAKPGVVKKLLQQAWARKAPKALLAT